MKRTIFFLIICLFTASIAEAQRRDIRRANRQLNRGNLESALEHIRDAFKEEETKDNAEAWLTRGQIYMEIAITEEPEYMDLVENPVQKADEAIAKAEELDDNGDLILDLQQAKLVLSEVIFNTGVRAFEAEQWVDASKMFHRSYVIAESFGSIDTLTLYNAALAAELGQSFDDAKSWYLKLVEMEHDEPYLYSSLSNISMAKGDTVQATEFVQKGRERYPDNLDLIFNEANIHIFTGNVEAARDILDLAIERDPENPNLFFAFAANYDKMAQDTTYSEEEREFAFEQAEQAYNQAIELDDEYFDAIYNLGVLYYNKGIQLFEEADERLRETQDFAQYEEDEKEFREIWLQAQPHLERAKELIDEDNPNYEIVIISLVQLYARTEQLDKLQEIEEIYLKYFGDEEE